MKPVPIRARAHTNKKLTFTYNTCGRNSFFSLFLTFLNCWSGSLAYCPWLLNWELAPLYLLIGLTALTGLLFLKYERGSSLRVLFDLTLVYIPFLRACTPLLENWISSLIPLLLAHIALKYTFSPRGMRLWTIRMKHPSQRINIGIYNLSSIS